MEFCSICACGKWICTSQKCPQHSQHHIRSDLAFLSVWVRFYLHSFILLLFSAPRWLRSLSKMWKTTRKKITSRWKKITTPWREITTCQKTTRMWKTSDGSKSLKHNYSRGQETNPWWRKTFWEKKQVIPEMEIQIKKSPNAEERQLVPSFGNILPNWRERNQCFLCFHL